QAACDAIKKAAFKTSVRLEASSSVKKGVVISTSPPGGTEIDKGKTVTVNVSTGPAPVGGPDVVGEHRGAACAARGVGGRPRAPAPPPAPPRPPTREGAPGARPPPPPPCPPAPRGGPNN